MENSKLWEVLQAFSVREWNNLLKRLEGGRPETLRLAKLIRERLDNGALSKETAFTVVFNKQPYREKAIRYEMSYLFQEVKAFMIQSVLEEDPILSQQLLCKALDQKNLDRSFAIEKRKWQKMLDEHPYHDNRSFRLREEKALADYNEAVQNSRQAPESFFELSRQSTLYFVSSKLRYTCIGLSHQTVSQAAREEDLLREVLDQVESGKFAEEPAIMIYYYAYKALTDRENPAHFDRLKQGLHVWADCFPLPELRDQYLLAINYCIRQSNTGRTAFLSELFELYQEGLEKQVFFEQGYLSRFTYHNILRTAIGLQAYDWAQDFLLDYKEYIEPPFREPTYHYNQAFLDYTRKEYQKAVEHLNQSITKDLYLELDVRRLRSKIYFEQEEWQALDYLLDSFKSYLYRHPRIGYHKRSYQKYIGFLRKLMEMDRLLPAEKEKLQQEIAKEPVADQRWLLDQLGA